MKKSVTDWLLEENQPSVRYLTLTTLLGKSEGDPEAKAARENITRNGWAKDILDKQNSSGFWVSGRNLFFPKYIATNWMLLILSDLGLTGTNPRIKGTIQAWTKRFSAKDGGFNDVPSEGGHLCITANTVRTLVKFGSTNDPRVTKAFDWLVKHQYEDGGWDCFERGVGCLDAWEPLSAFASYPRQKWTRSMKQSVERGAEFYLERELYKADERYEPWFRFHYPVHYYYDLLVGLDFMTVLGYTEDKRLGYAIKLLKGKMRPDGRWNLDSVNPDTESPQAREDGKHPEEATTPFALEKPGEPSKMITLTALRVLSRAGEVDHP